jgi:hypothetical protein
MIGINGGFQPRSKARASSFEELQKTVVTHLGLEESDAIWLWEHWQANGWTKDGEPIVDWRSIASSWERMKRFPSQK